MRPLTVLVLAIALTHAAPAFAHDTFVPTTTTATAEYNNTQNTYDFSGTVSSPKATCIRFRDVLVYRIRQDTDERQNIETTTSNLDGKWRIEDVGDDETVTWKYYVKVSRSVLSDRPGHVHGCAKYAPKTPFETSG